MPRRKVRKWSAVRPSSNSQAKAGKALTPIGKAVTVSGDLYASVFIDAGWLTLYQNPYASGSNQARLAGAGVGLSWEGPRYWRASFSISQPIGNAPSQLSGSRYLHANAWLEVSKGFR